MTTDVLLEVALIAVLVAINGALAASEIALISARRHHLVRLAEQKNSNAQIALRLLSNMGRLLATIQVGITVAGFFASAVGAVAFVLVLSSFLGQAPLALIGEWSGPLAVVLVTFLISFVTIVFGELVPKRLAIRHAESIALAVARPVEWLAAGTAPLVNLLNGTAGIVLWAFGLRRDGDKERPTITEAELRGMFDVAALEGEVEPREAEMLHGIFEFTDKLVGEVITPRTDIQWLNRDDTIADLITAFKESYHTRYPLCDDNPDNIRGILHIKDVLPGLGAGDLSPQDLLAPLSRPAYFVPESKRLGELFEEMRSAGEEMVIVVDEYGGTAGLVTLKQLVQEIVGRIQEARVPRGRPEYEPIDSATFLVAGGMRIDEAAAVLGVELPHDDYETIAGLVLDRLGHVPQVGEEIAEGQAVLTVVEVHGAKIERVQVRRLAVGERREA